jgi:hypothetical protein
MGARRLRGEPRYPGQARQTAEGLAAKGKACDLTELLREVVAVETGMEGTGQIEDAVPHTLWQAVVAGPAAAGAREMSPVP